MIRVNQYFRRFFSPFRVINPLRFHGFAAYSWCKMAIIKNIYQSAVVDFPQSADFSVTQKLFKIPFLQGITNIAAFQKFYSIYDFLRQTFFHTRYILVTHKDKLLYNGKVYNLAISQDESYITEIGITHNCRCVATEVLARESKLSNSADAIKKGEAATSQIGKNGKNKLEMFRFNPGMEKKVFPPKNAYNPKHCDGAKLSLTGLIGHSVFVLNAENEKCKAKKIIESLVDEKESLKSTFKEARKKFTGTIETKRFGSVLISKTGFEKTQNINQGSIINQINSLNEIGNLKNYLNEYKGKIILEPINNPEKIKKKNNVIGYVKVETKNGFFEIGLEKDRTLKEDYKFYYIKKVLKL